MITKETFCKTITMIREQTEIDRQITEALQMIIDGYFVYGTKSKYLQALLLVLKEALDDKYNYIEWWLYDTDDYLVMSGEGLEWNLETPESLYDYITGRTKT